MVNFLQRLFGRRSSLSSLSGAQSNSCDTNAAAENENSSTESSKKELLACVNAVFRPPQPSSTRDARQWEILLEDIFDCLGGEALLRAERVCRSWRASSQDPTYADKRLTKLAAYDFGIPTSNDGQLQLWGADPQTKPDKHQMELIVLHEQHKAGPLSSPFRSGRAVRKLLDGAICCFGGKNRDAKAFGRADPRPGSAQKILFPAMPDKISGSQMWAYLNHFGWYVQNGLEAMDYVHQFYVAQIIGFDTHNWEAHGPGEIAPAIRTLSPDSFRVKIHFEGWATRWDEWIVLPEQAHRLKPHAAPRPGGQARMGQQRSDPACRIGAVCGLQVEQADGSVQAAAVVGMTPTLPADAPLVPGLAARTTGAAGPTGVAQAGPGTWDTVRLQFLVRYEDGAQEWLNLCDPAQRARLRPYTRRYPPPRLAPRATIVDPPPAPIVQARPAEERTLASVPENTGELPQFERGARVEATWKGGRRLYPGTVGQTHEGGLVEIWFDDGDYEPRQPARLIWPLQVTRGPFVQAARPVAAEGVGAEGVPTPLPRYADGQLVPGDGVFESGARVEATWKGGQRLYPGTVGQTHADGTVEIRFDDGDYEPHQPAHLIWRETARPVAAEGVPTPLRPQGFAEGQLVDAIGGDGVMMSGRAGRSFEDGTVEVWFDNGFVERKDVRLVESRF